MNPNFNIQPDELIEKKAATPSEQTLEHAPRALRTFEEDIADAMRDGKGSVLTVALAEQKRKSDSVTFAVEKTSNIWLIVFGVMFLLAALSVLGYIGYTKYIDKISLSKNPEQNSIIGTNILSADKVIKVDINKLLPKNGITQSLIYASGGSDISTRSIQLVVATILDIEKNALLADNKILLPRIAPHAPAILSRSLSGNILFGIYSGDTATPFIVLRSSSYEGVFSGLLEWEEFMSDDLFTFMGVSLPNSTQSAETVPSSGLINVASSSASSSSAIVTEASPGIKPSVRDINKFVDRTIKNKDVRVLQDDTGRIYFIYGFANPDTVIMTTSVESFFEISSRLR